MTEFRRRGARHAFSLVFGLLTLFVGLPAAGAEPVDDAAVAAGLDSLHVSQTVAWALEGVARPEKIGRVRFAAEAARPRLDPDVHAAGMRLADVTIAGEEVAQEGGRRVFGTLTHESPLGFRAINDFAARYRTEKGRYVVEESHAQARFLEAPRVAFAAVEAAKVPAEFLGGAYEPHRLVSFLRKNGVDPTRVDEAPREYVVFAVLLDRLPPGKGFFVSDETRKKKKPKRTEAGLTVFSRERWHAAALRSTFAFGAKKPRYFHAAVTDERGRSKRVGLLESGGLVPFEPEG